MRITNDSLEEQVASGLSGLRDYALSANWTANSPVPEENSRQFAVVSLDGVANVEVRFTRTNLDEFGVEAFILTCSLPSSLPKNIVSAVLTELFSGSDADVSRRDDGDCLLFFQVVLN